MGALPNESPQHLTSLLDTKKTTIMQRVFKNKSLCKIHFERVYFPQLSYKI